MAIVHADNFNIYGTNAALLLNGVYGYANGVQLAADPYGTPNKVLYLPPVYGGAGNAAILRYILKTNSTTVGTCLRLWLTTLPTEEDIAQGWAIKDSVGNYIASVRVTQTGRLRVYKNDLYGTVLAETAAPAISANGWWHIETKFVINGASSSIDLYVEGINVLSVTGVDLGIVPASMVQLINDPNGVSYSIDMYCKDWVIWDNSTAYNNDVLGTVLVANLPLTQDVALNWTPSTGTTGYSILDNVPPNDSQYISAAYPGTPPAYVGDFANVPADISSVRALVTYVRAAKVDGGDGSLQTGIISSPSDTPATSLGVNRPITATPTYWLDVFQTDPKTSAPWIPSAVNTAQLSINRTV